MSRTNLYLSRGLLSLFLVYLVCLVALSNLMDPTEPLTAGKFPKVQTSASASVSAEDLLVEETKEDGKDPLEPSKILLPTFTFQLPQLDRLKVFTEPLVVTKEHTPIFLTTHDLRI